MTSKQNNYLREREKANARSPFSKRTPERVIMCAGAVYSVGMAIFFALSYFGVISSTSEAARTSAQAVTALSRNSSNTALIILYAIVTAGTEGDTARRGDHIYGREAHAARSAVQMDGRLDDLRDGLLAVHR